MKKESFKPPRTDRVLFYFSGYIQYDYKGDDMSVEELQKHAAEDFKKTNFNGWLQQFEAVGYQSHAYKIEER